MDMRRLTLRGWLRALVGDERGTSMVTAVITLPLLIVILLGIFYLFEVMSVKWVLDRGTREAARYITDEGRWWNLEPKIGANGVMTTSLPADYYDLEAKRIVLSRLRDVFNDYAIYNIVTKTLVVNVTEPILAKVPGATPDPDYVEEGAVKELCETTRRYKAPEPGTFRHPNNVRFRVYSELDMPVRWVPRLPYTDPYTITLKLKSRATGYVQCVRWSGENQANFTSIDKIKFYSEEGPAVPYRDMATPWFPTVTAVPTATGVPTATFTPTP